ncbi:MAG: GDSL-type esterase/lipase family protein [Agathobacter sp.]
MKMMKKLFVFICILTMLATDLTLFTATENDAEILFEGSSSGNSQGTNLTFFYTKHVGGKWDASAINEGSYLYAEYEGAKDGIYLAFASASGGTQWVAVYPDETGVTEDGRYYAKFSYENFSKKYGTNFARLDQIQAYVAKNQQVILKKIVYVPGTGDPVDTSDGTWDRPTTGIAFIGDSIVQNPLVDIQHLKGIDWNGILDRTDCVNYGIGGQTTNELLPRIGEVASKDYEKVVFLCGINDIGRGISNATIKNNYASMIETLTAQNPDIEIYIISVLPTTDAFYTNMQSKISGLNVVLFGLCQQYENVTYVDCYSSFVGEDKYCKEGLTFDGLHPNLDGYEIIASILNPYLETEEAGEEETEIVDETQNQGNGNDIIWVVVFVGIVILLLAGGGVYGYKCSNRDHK